MVGKIGMKKKTFLGVIVALFVVIVVSIMCIVLKLNNNGGGRMINNTSDVFAFSCHCDYGNPLMEGGSYTTSYDVVIRDNKIHIFDIYLGTTADCGYTVEYVTDISDSDIKTLKHSGWKRRYEYCESVIRSDIGYTVLTEGMNDEDSKNPDGSYKWESYFRELAGLD